jgi:hypothetical protein
VWSIVDGPYTHHNGSAQAFADPDGRTRFVWITDLLPNDLADRTTELMERALSVIKETQESASTYRWAGLRSRTSRRSAISALDGPRAA